MLVLPVGRLRFPASRRHRALEDRAWIVASDIDLPCTYLACSAPTAAAVVAEERLEALPCRPEDRITYDSDTVNGRPR